MKGHGGSRNTFGRSASGASRRPGTHRGHLLLEHLEQRNLLTIYQPIGVTLAPSPVEGTAFAGAVVGTFTSTSPLGGLSATINWGPTATPTSSIGTINMIGSNFIPGVGTVPQYSVTGGTTYPEYIGASSQPITVTISDSTDSTNGVITSNTTVADAPLTTTGGIASASVTEGANVNYTGAIALMTYTDANPNSTAAEFSASIDWGDGSPSTLGTITKSGATYTVSGRHTFATHTTGTPRTVRVTVSDLGGATATHTTTITVTDAALSGPTAIPITAAQGQFLTNVPLGTFLDGNPLGDANDFTVSINWGDGVTNDPGFVTLVGGSANNAKFAVSGSHQYTSAAGSPYAVTVSVTDKGGSTTTINTAATVTVTPLEVSVSSINATAATPTSSQVLATFFDAGGAGPLGNYSATVLWGDGTSDGTSGTVSISAVSGQPGFFAVNAPAHTYATPGLYPITVQINDTDGTSGGGNGSALVAPASLSAITSPDGPITVAVEGQPLPASTSLASFTSGDPNATPAGFSAIVDWGDGTPSTLGTITQPGGSGTDFLVSGGHTYDDANADGHTVTVRVTDAFNTTADATTVVTTVADAPLMLGTSLPIAASKHVPLISVPVATFVDTNPGASAADFSASIDWGDGTADDANAQVVLVGGNASGAIFAIYGSHTFDEAGSYSISVDVLDTGGQTLAISPATANANVVSSSLSVAALPQAVQPGASIPAGTVIGTFNDALGADPVGRYAASIDWGDGSAADSDVTITSLGGSVFSVSTGLGHTYADPGSYALKLTVTNAPGSGIGGSLVVVNGSVTPPTPPPTPPTPPTPVASTATLTSLAASAGSSVVGQPVTFTAMVAPATPSDGTPTGLVTFFDGPDVIGAVMLSDGSASLTVSDLAYGSHSIRASYAGGPDFEGSSSDSLPFAVGITLGDYDGDGVADLALFEYVPELNSGRFDIQLSSGGTLSELIGIEGDIPVVGDFDGDGRSDIAVFSPNFGGDQATWTIVRSSDDVRQVIAFGAPGLLDVPAPADYDGDGITDIATFRADSDVTPGAAQWFILPSGDPMGGYSVTFGGSGGMDVPVPADYDGDGRADVATFRADSDVTPGAAQWFILPSGDPMGGYSVTFGGSGGMDVPVPADYDGDGRADVATFRANSDQEAASAEWFILSSSQPGFAAKADLGAPGSLDAAGDYDGDGVADLATFDRVLGQWRIRPLAEADATSTTFGPNGGRAVPVLSSITDRLAASAAETGPGATSSLVDEAVAGLARSDVDVM